MKSLRARLTMTLGGITLLTVALYALIVSNVLERLVIENLSTDLQVQAHLLAGRVAADLVTADNASIQQILSEFDTASSARALVVDARRRTVGASEAGDHRTLGLPSEREGMIRALAGETVRGIPGRKQVGDEVLYVATPVMDGGQVVGAIRLAYQLDDIKGSLDRLNLGIGLGALGVALAVGLVALAIATSMSTPIHSLSLATKALAAGDLHQRVTTSATDEIGVLSQSFNELATRLADLETGREEFASDISHELRALAGAMRTAIEALGQGADRDPELKRDLMDGLTGHSSRLVRLADDLRELARAGTSWLSIETEAVSLLVIARQAAAEWAAEAERRSVRLQVTGDPLAIVNGDRDRLIQACGNLIENALKYAAAGGWVRVSVTSGVRMHTLTVEDNGPGIPTNALSAIFHRSYRVEGRSSEGPGGMGLGLAIVDRIVRAHCGSVTASNLVDQGASFAIRLPAYVDTATDDIGTDEGIRSPLIA